MTHIVFKLFFLVVTAAFGVALLAAQDEGSQPKDGWRRHLDVIINVEVSQQERLEAVEAIIALNDAAALRPVFKMLTQPVGDWDVSQPIISGVPDRVYAPSMQIPAARLRVFKHLARHAEPEETRKRVYAELLDEVQEDFEYRELLFYAVCNRSPDVEQKLWNVFANRHERIWIRASAVSVLADGASGRSRRQIIEYIWAERGSELASNLGSWVWKHPYGSALKLDWYDRERNPETRRSHMSMRDVADRMDESFNITGLYRDPWGEGRDLDHEIARQRNVLEAEARETGDDTKLRTFEAELVAKQQAELEKRIEKIDAWITANRERLEREAAEYTPPELPERFRKSAPEE